MFRGMILLLLSYNICMIKVTANLIEVCSQFDHACLWKRMKSRFSGGGLHIYIYYIHIYIHITHTHIYI